MPLVTLRAWCESHELSYTNAARWRHLFDDFPPAVEVISRTYMYDPDALDAWKEAHPALGLPPGEAKKRKLS